MKNPATHNKHDQLNSFTEVIADRCLKNSTKKFARLRDGTSVARADYDMMEIIGYE